MLLSKLKISFSQYYFTISYFSAMEKLRIGVKTPKLYHRIFLEMIQMIDSSFSKSKLVFHNMILTCKFLFYLFDCTGKKAKSRNTGEKLKMTWEKMSKSKYNGVEPGDVIDKYGIDTTRLFILFRVSPLLHREWNESCKCCQGYSL